MQVSPFWLRLDPEHALEEPRMAIRVPGEFHEGQMQQCQAGAMQGNPGQPGTTQDNPEQDGDAFGP